MAFCGVCGTMMDTKYCPDDGWSETSGADQSRRFKARDNYGTMPTTQGDQSPIYMGSNAEITPATKRSEEKRVIRTFWVKFAGFLGLLGSVASITGFTLGKLHLDGLVYDFTHYAFQMDTAAATKRGSITALSSVEKFIPPSTVALFLSLVVLILSMALFVYVVSLFGTLNFRGYRFSRRSRILESRDGWLSRSKITGDCPRDGGLLTLRRMVTGTEKIKGKDKEGNPTEKEKDVKQLKLVCAKNKVDHQFKFDPTEIREYTGRAEDS
jgi:hypothetical protein